MRSNIQEVFTRNAEKYGKEARLSLQFPTYIRYAIADCSGPAIPIEEAEAVVRSWFQHVLADHGMDWAGVVYAASVLGRELAKHLSSSFGKNIDQYRRECGWTIDELADIMEMDRTSILNHINHKRRPRPDALARYAQSFGEKLERDISTSDLA